MKKKAVSIAAIVFFILTFATLTANGQDEIKIYEGASVTFSASAESSSPVTFSWQKDGKDTGVIGNLYVITSVKPSDSGSYSVIASNSVGSTQSNTLVIKLVVLPPKEAFDTYEVIGMLEALRKDWAIACLSKRFKRASSGKEEQV